MAESVIPRGKEIRIFQNGKNILDQDGIAPGLKLVIEEDVVINLSSKFSPLYDNSGNNLLNVVGTAIRDLTGGGFSSQFKEFGFQYWTGSEPATMNFTFTFRYGQANEFSGLREVVNPMKALMFLCLPSEGQNEQGINTLIPPGPSILTLLNSETQETLNINTRQLSCQVGEYLRFPGIIVRRAEPQFSRDCDSDGNPIWGKVQVEISTIFNATTNLFQITQDQFNSVIN